MRISVPSHYWDCLSWGSVSDAGPEVSESRLGEPLPLDAGPQLAASFYGSQNFASKHLS